MPWFKAVWVGASLLGLRYGLEWSSRAQEAWVLVGPPPWTNTVFQTVGGITYFTHTSWVAICHRVTAQPWVRAGTNFYQVVNYEQFTGICAACECYAPETHVTVFGALAPGDYALQVWSWNPGLMRNVPFATLVFHVPGQPSVTLTCLPVTNGAPLQLTVAGLPNVQYVIEATSTFNDWTPIATNLGGPFVWAAPAQPTPGQFFYRARIAGN